MSSMWMPMSIIAPPPALSALVNQVPSPGMPWRRIQPVLA